MSLFDNLRSAKKLEFSFFDGFCVSIFGEKVGFLCFCGFLRKEKSDFCDNLSFRGKETSVSEAEFLAKKWEISFRAMLFTLWTAGATSPIRGKETSVSEGEFLAKKIGKFRFSGQVLLFSEKRWEKR